MTVNPANLQAAPQSNGKGAIITLDTSASTGNLLVNGAINANGINGGSGGVVTIKVDTTAAFDISSTATTNGINGTNPDGSYISATGGPSGGSGGTVTVTNIGIGGIVMSSPTNINVNATIGAGGQISLLAPNGPLTIPGGTLSANAAGGNFKGGSVTLTGQEVTSTTSPLSVSANGSGTGNGGTITITATNATNGSVSLGNANPGDINISATSGASGGNGGTVIVNAAANITANLGSSNSLNVTPSASGNGNGGNITLNAGTSGTGLLQVTGNLNANAAGTGNGGTVTITFPQPSGALPLLVGAQGTVLQNWITGNINADAPSSGVGGTVNISNITNTSGANLNISLTGTISANSASNTIGNVNFNVKNGSSGSGQSVIVQPTAAGEGTINGYVNAVASNVTVEADAPNENLFVGNLSATQGNVRLDAIPTLTTDGGQVYIGQGNTVSATGTINVNTRTFTDIGTVTTNAAGGGSISVYSPDNLTVAGQGTVSTTGAGANTIMFAAGTNANGTEAAGSNYTLSLGGALTLVPTTATSKVVFQSEQTGSTIVNANGTGQIINSGATLDIYTPNLNLGSGTPYSASGASTINIAGNNPTDGSTNQALTITSPSGSSSTISTVGGPAINVFTNGTGQNISFNNSSGTASTLNLNGAPVTITATGATTAVATNETVSSDHNITIDANASGVTAGTINNNGVITSSAAAGTILVQSTAAGNLNVGGTGSYTTTGAGANAINFETTAAAGNVLTFTGSPVITPGTSGTVLIQSPSTTSSVVLATDQTVDVTNGTALNVFTSNLTMNSGSTLRGDGTTVPITIENSGAAGLDHYCTVEWHGHDHDQRWLDRWRCNHH